MGHARSGKITASFSSFSVSSLLTATTTGAHELCRRIISLTLFREYCNWHGGGSCHIIGATLSRAPDKELYACEAALSLLEARGRATPRREQTAGHATLDKLTACRDEVKEGSSGNSLPPQISWWLEPRCQRQYKPLHLMMGMKSRSRDAQRIFCCLV